MKMENIYLKIYTEGLISRLSTTVDGRLLQHRIAKWDRAEGFNCRTGLCARGTVCGNRFHNGGLLFAIERIVGPGDELVCVYCEGQLQLECNPRWEAMERCEVFGRNGEEGAFGHQVGGAGVRGGRVEATGNGVGSGGSEEGVVREELCPKLHTQD